MPPAVSGQVSIPGHDFGRMALALADRVKDLLVPLEDVCRYREQRNEDFAAFEATPRNKQALVFKVAIAPGGVNLETAHFKIREFPVTESNVMAGMIEAILQGRVRQITRESASGKALAAKTYVFSDTGAILFKHKSQFGILAGLTRTARRKRTRFQGYRPPVV
jgi:hypothetical protein